MEQDKIYTKMMTHESCAKVNSSQFDLNNTTTSSEVESSLTDDGIMVNDGNEQDLKSKQDHIKNTIHEVKRSIEKKKNQYMLTNDSGDDEDDPEVTQSLQTNYLTQVETTN